MKRIVLLLFFLWLFVSGRARAEGEDVPPKPAPKPKPPVSVRFDGTYAPRRLFSIRSCSSGRLAARPLMRRP